ncbi:cellulose binding domain-containing protein [Micromonospora sp. NPDC047707]|uniref:cellulose binding domain-containing protein n=1 Tax=Micromonospora sp. NPDC047707 TaxID=3154498 RepID=UPI0034522037
MWRTRRTRSTAAPTAARPSGLTIDRKNPNTLLVATQISWWPDAVFWRSTDGGATWSRIWDWSSYPNRAKKYTMDISSVPWLTFGANPSPPEEAPKLGWMNESVEIDPHDSDRFLYGTGATIYGSTDLTRWDTGGTFTIRPMVKGLEETAVLDLVSPPSGAPLVSALGDIGGFRHTNHDVVPSTMFTQPVFTRTTSLDYAEANPSVMVRAGNFTDADRPNDSHVAFSTDGGANWFQGGEPGGFNNGGTVAAAADGSRFVWAPGDAGQQVVHTVGFGAIAGWTVGWTFPNGQRITQLWGGTHTQSGATVSVRDAGWNGNLSPGATTTVGFLASWTTTNSPPSAPTCTAR